MATKSAAELITAIQAGYTFEGPSIALGAAMVDGVIRPEAQVALPLAMMNRHGLVAGATGTGKTVTLHMIAEQLSTAGVPVFMADIKGDLTGLATAAEGNDKLTARTQALGQHWESKAFPVEFLALGGNGNGVPVRATIDSFGPILLSRVLDLNETQESSLQLVFHYADTKDFELYDLKDLRAVITFLTSDEGKADLKELGGLSKATAGVILRNLITLDAQGMGEFFGSPEFDTAELLRIAPDGRGVISCLELPSVQDKPLLFSTFLMWLLADLYRDLPEVGDIEKPKLVFFFDEAHLLFNNASKAFLAAITQTVRLIRSKGVGIFFVTQTPKDVPSDVLAQLANRVQHALRAFTPEDAKALKATVSTFPINDYDLEEVLTNAGIGEAVVTVMNENGAPTPVALTRLRAPGSVMGPSAETTVTSVIAASALLPTYGTAVDPVSAFEKLAAATVPAEAPQPPRTGPAVGTPLPPPPPPASLPSPKHDGGIASDVIGALGGAFGSGLTGGLKSAARSMGRNLIRDMFGTAPRKRRR
ncbi:ATP/GTP-binding motif-containing protein [Arthrobacter sp. PAMC 25486]|uniref:helicase HerA-like domain-containing protein n=1 Tax=Arthrobacter sp. PAMC 25486 TaxID=1494608 RepID=UPI0005359F58|nr:helicase HerA-like domain-containing protein [Arthrobacter sp. PAMC 25486]AIY02537.1 ATP/GTP-binding motif-containing protein [Arthrobacter sp. PAMC 25486]